MSTSAEPAQVNGKAAQPNGPAGNPNDANNSGLPPIPAGLADLPPNQIAAILQNLPDIFKNLAEGEAAATLSNLSQQAPFTLPHNSPYPPPIHAQHLPPGLEPGPSSHPRGPPNLGQLSNAAAGAMPMPPQPQGPSGMEEEQEEGGEGDKDQQGQNAAGAQGGRRLGRAALMTNDEWTRQRKDNHKEVERRRRGNINDGINELGRIVPNGTGEKAKGAILQRAVQYIHHLKENEARNIEKWTLEKLLMDQAMGDLQAQLEEVRRLWEEERNARVRAENELEVLRGVTGQPAPGQMANPAAQSVQKKEESALPASAPQSASSANGEGSESGKRGREDENEEDAAKRVRVE